MDKMEHHGFKPSPELNSKEYCKSIERINELPPSDKCIDILNLSVLNKPSSTWWLAQYVANIGMVVVI